MANQDRVNFIWGENALTTIPPVPVSEIAYRDTTQTPEQMAEGQKYDTIYNSARYNQMFYLVTAVAKTLCENGMMPFLAGQAYAHYARCIYTDGKIYVAQRAIEADESPFPTPGDESNVWLKEGGGGGNPAGSVIPFYSVNLGGPDNRNPIFWGQSEPDTSWLICDGGSDGRGGSVPDLRGKFVMCSTYSGDAGQTGGATSVTPTVSVQNATQGGSIGATTATGNIAVSGTNLSVQGTTLDGNTLPSHAHQPQAAQVCDSGTGRFCVDAGAGERAPYSWVTAAGNSQAHAHSVYDPGHSHGFSAAPHTHSFTGVAHTHTATVSAISTVPPYYKMAYCVKLPE
jgi:hypothetical protein